MQSESGQDTEMQPAEAVDEVVVNEGEEEADDTPEFIEAGDAVEVEVDNDDIPMEDDDGEEEALASKPAVIDMSGARLESHSGPIYAVASHRDTTGTLTVVSGGGDDRAFLHKIPPGGAAPETRPLEYPHTDSVSSVALNLDHVSADLTKTPKYCAVGGYDGAILVYDPDTGRKVKNFEGPTDVECLEFHPKGGTVLLAGSAADNTIWMFHILLEQCLQVFVGHESAVTAVSFTPDGKVALSASADGTVRVWAPRTGQAKHIFRLGEQQAGLTSLATGGGSDKQLIIAGAEDGQAHVCHVGTKKVVASLRHFEAPPQSVSGDDDEEMEYPMSVEAVGFGNETYNSNWCATAGVDGVLKVWDLSNGAQCRQTCTMPVAEGETTPPGVTRIAWHQSKPLVFCSTTDGNIHICDARNGQLVSSLTGHANVINDMAVTFSNDGSAVICAGSDDETVRVFDVKP